jgi:hypothetical protein
MRIAGKDELGDTKSMVLLDAVGGRAPRATVSELDE